MAEYKVLEKEGESIVFVDVSFDQDSLASQLEP